MGGNAWKGKPIGRNLHTAVLLFILLAAVASIAVVSRAEAEPPGVIRIGTAAYATAVTERCPVAQRAIGFYRQKYRAHREKMGLPGPVPRVWYLCDAARRRAGEWRERAADAKAALDEWFNDQWNWQAWLPAKWQRIGACETGYGRIPGNWRHKNSEFEGAFGFRDSSWDWFVGSADPKWGPYPADAHVATPRQQYEVALAIYRRYGLSGWGCRGA